MNSAGTFPVTARVQGGAVEGQGADEELWWRGRGRGRWGDGDTKVEIWVQLVTAVICTSRISLPGRLPDWQEEQGGS